MSQADDRALSVPWCLCRRGALAPALPAANDLRQAAAYGQHQRQPTTGRRGASGRRYMLILPTWMRMESLLLMRMIWMYTRIP